MVSTSEAYDNFAKKVEDKPKVEDEKRELSASEAVYGFAGWLVSREASVTLSRYHDAAIAAELCDAFCKANELSEPTQDFGKVLKHPAKSKDPTYVAEGGK